jgi:hypothetical protein
VVGLLITALLVNFVPTKLLVKMFKLDLLVLNVKKTNLAGIGELPGNVTTIRPV